MGAGPSGEEGPKAGYHVLHVQPGSPGETAGLQSFFDFIVAAQGIQFLKADDQFVEILKTNVGKDVHLVIYNMKTERLRETVLIPSTSWGGSGLAGISIRFCTFEHASEHVWHIMDVYPNSPASIAGLQPRTDYIVGTPETIFNDSEDFFALVSAKEKQPVTLYVYSVITDTIRVVTITPNSQWGGTGSLGCDVGYGYLHRIPLRGTVSKTSEQNYFPQPVTQPSGTGTPLIPSQYQLPYVIPTGVYYPPQQQLSPQSQQQSPLPPQPQYVYPYGAQVAFLAANPAQQQIPGQSQQPLQQAVFPNPYVAYQFPPPHQQTLLPQNVQNIPPQQPSTSAAVSQTTTASPVQSLTQLPSLQSTQSQSPIMQPVSPPTSPHPSREQLLAPSVSSPHPGLMQSPFGPNIPYPMMDQSYPFQTPAVMPQQHTAFLATPVLEQQSSTTSSPAPSPTLSPIVVPGVSPSAKTTGAIPASPTQKDLQGQTSTSTGQSSSGEPLQEIAL